MKLKILKASYHRNGIAGAGFYAIIFKDMEEKRTMVASLFDESSYCAVYDIALLQKGDVEFGSNSWRGDVYESALKPLLKKFLKKNGTNRLGPFAFPGKVKEDES